LFWMKRHATELTGAVRTHHTGSVAFPRAELWFPPFCRIALSMRIGLAALLANLRRTLPFRLGQPTTLAEASLGSSSSAGRQPTQASGAISVLLLASGPSAIRWRVVTVVVNAINGILSRPFAHVGHETSERCPPPFTDRNTPATISRIGGMLWIQAALLHRNPDLVQRMPRVMASCVTVNDCAHKTR
jgi:hypothetical protein